MKAEIIAVGTELLLGQTVDTNSAEIGHWLAELGIGVYYHQTVGDNGVRLGAVLHTALARSDVVVVTGGLGPTEDDMTREAVAIAADEPLCLDPQAEAHIEAYFRQLGRDMSANNRRQAYIPRGARTLANPIGTAPGIYMTIDGVHVFCLPGVPVEMRAMWHDAVKPHLQALTAGAPTVIRSRTLRFYGIGESDLETRVRDLLHSDNPTVAPYAGQGETRLRITARAGSEDEADQLILPVEGQIIARVGRWMYGRDEDTVESMIGRRLTETGQTVTVAESCTGGLIAHRLTNVPGSSGYFHTGWVVYANEAKTRELGVDHHLLEKYGAVSPHVAAAMAAGALRRAQSDLALAVTGIAGPGGGTAEKPVGLVYFGLAGVGPVRAYGRRFPPSRREIIKERSAGEALHLLLTALSDKKALPENLI